MASRAFAILLLSLAANKVYTSPIIPCPPPALPAPLPAPCPAAAPAAAPEVFLQNNGQPLVVYAYNSDGDAQDIDLSAYLPSPLDASALPDVCPLPVPVPAPLPPADLPLPIDSNAAEIANAEALADQPIADTADVAEPAVPAAPCKIETNTEIVKEAGETVVHQPSPIYINQPPTRLIINHAPYVIRPAPVLLHKGGNTITKEITKKYLPSPIQVRPVYVRIVKPIEKKVLVDAPTEKPTCAQKIINPPVVNPCDYVAPAPLPLPCPPAPLPPAPLPLPCAPAPLPPAPLPLPCPPAPLPLPCPPAPLPPAPLPLPCPPAPLPSIDLLNAEYLTGDGISASSYLAK